MSKITKKTNPEIKIRQRPLLPALQSHSFSRSYGTNLPTSLIYIILIGQRLRTLETWCGYWYDLSWWYYSFQWWKEFLHSLGFSRSTQWAQDTSKKRHVLPVFLTLSPDNQIPGTFFYKIKFTVKEKRELSLGHWLLILLVHLCYHFNPNI